MIPKTESFCFLGLGLFLGGGRGAGDVEGHYFTISLLPIHDQFGDFQGDSK